MGSEALCDFCNSIDFGVVGFHGPDFDVFSLTDATVALDTILRSSEQCFFCRIIAKLFRGWESQKFGKEALHLGNACVDVSSLMLESLERDDQGLPKGHLVRISVSVCVKEPFPSDIWCGPSMEFQKFSDRSPTVSDICNAESLFDWENEHLEAYGGRKRPLEADMRLFCKWKESCCDIHGDYCNRVFTGKRLPQLRLIDVENRCVVDSEDDGSYAALSYVWGQAALPELTKSTDENFRRPGSLNSDMLPSTLDDAIIVTRGLGEKYIWIDCLCIMQDDDADKLKFIHQMDSIFGFASVTIVAASGVDVKSGLPGIKPKSRAREQTSFKIKGVSLLATLDQGGSGEVCSYLGESKWYRRGWTFQEKLFSRRALIFAPEQVYWECQRASWCEDGFWETMKSPTIYRQCFNEEDFRQPWCTDVRGFERTYRKLVDEYSVRTLTKLSDGLDAFAGILNHFESQAGQEFLWGLPTAFLSTALTWPCDRAVKRRLDKRTLRAEDGTTTLCPFPSWSWVGWVGETHYTQVFDSLNKLDREDLIFYLLKGNDLAKIVQADLEILEGEHFPPPLWKEDNLGPILGRLLKADPATHNNEEECSSPWIWKEENPRMIVTMEDIPASILERSIGSNILFFWSSSAELHVRYHDEDRAADRKPSLSCNGRVVPSSWSHVPQLNPGHDSPAEFIVIGRENATRARNLSAPTLAVLFVSREDDVAYRRGLVNIKVSDWMRVRNRVWKLISLG